MTYALYQSDNKTRTELINNGGNVAAANNHTNNDDDDNTNANVDASAKDIVNTGRGQAKTGKGTKRAAIKDREGMNFATDLTFV